MRSGNQDPATRVPTTYELEGFVYRKPPRTERWAIRKSKDSNALVYQLDPEGRGGFLSFVGADENILLMLDDAGEFLVRDVHYRYTLNRIK